MAKFTALSVVTQEIEHIVGRNVLDIIRQAVVVEVVIAYGSLPAHASMMVDLTNHLGRIYGLHCKGMQNTAHPIIIILRIYLLSHFKEIITVVCVDLIDGTIASVLRNAGISIVLLVVFNGPRQTYTLTKRDERVTMLVQDGTILILLSRIR